MYYYGARRISRCVLGWCCTHGTNSVDVGSSGLKTTKHSQVASVSRQTSQAALGRSEVAEPAHRCPPDGDAMAPQPCLLLRTTVDSCHKTNTPPSQQDSNNPWKRPHTTVLHSIVGYRARPWAGKSFLSGSSPCSWMNATRLRATSTAWLISF